MSEQPSLEKVPQTLLALLHPGWLTVVSGGFSQCSRNKKIKKIPVNIIHMLIDWDNTDRPHRRTTLIASELARYKIDFAALSETSLQTRES